LPIKIRKCIIKYLEELHRLKIFHKKEIVVFAKNENAAKEILQHY